jgi:MOSC domain-containing protein YiiM
MKIAHIIIGAKPKEPLHYVNSVQAYKGRGLKGDRYYHGIGTFNKHNQLDQKVREISIFSYENLKEVNSRLDTELDFLDLRRNLIIKDFDYEKLKDNEFCIGTAKFKIVRTAPPCRYLSRLLGVDIMLGLKYIGGYRAVVTKSGVINVSDDIIVK